MSRDAVSIRFGPYRVHPIQGLSLDDREIHVTPRSLAVLYVLARRSREIVTKAELFEEVWRDSVVTDAALSFCIRELRRALGDDARDPRFIETVHRRGFRLILPAVTPVVGSSAAFNGVAEDRVDGERFERRSSADHSPRASPTNLAAPANDIAEILATAAPSDDVDLTLPSQPSIAILPLVGAGGGAAPWDVVADGLTNDLITGMARARWLFVVARGSAFKFRAGPYDAREIGRVLGVHYVLQGSVRVADGQVSVHAVLSDAADGRELWAEHYRREIGNIFEVQAAISERIVGSVESEVEHSLRGRAILQPPTNLDAWSAYHRGCWHMYRFAPEACEEAEQLFKLSVRLDPNAPRAYAGLSFVHWQRAFLELTADRNGEVERALDFARQGIAADPRDPLGHWSLGRAFLLRREFDLAVDELESAVDLNPSFASAHYSLGFTLMHRGDTPSSNDALDRARRLSPYDPLTFAMFAVRAQNLTFAGDYAGAARMATKAASLPNAHHHIVAIAAVCNTLDGREEAAKGYYAKLQALQPGYGAAAFFRAFPWESDAYTQVVGKAFARLAARA